MDSTVKLAPNAFRESEFTVTFTEPEMRYLLGITAESDEDMAKHLFVKLDAQYITGRRRDGKVM